MEKVNSVIQNANKMKIKGHKNYSFLIWPYEWHSYKDTKGRRLKKREEKKEEEKRECKWNLKYINKF